MSCAKKYIIITRGPILQRIKIRIRIVMLSQCLIKKLRRQCFIQMTSVQASNGSERNIAGCFVFTSFVRRTDAMEILFSHVV